MKTTFAHPHLRKYKYKIETWTYNSFIRGLLSEREVWKNEKNDVIPFLEKSSREKNNPNEIDFTVGRQRQRQRQGKDDKPSQMRLTIVYIYCRSSLLGIIIQKFRNSTLIMRFHSTVLSRHCKLVDNFSVGTIPHITWLYFLYQLIYAYINVDYHFLKVLL